MRIRSVRLKDQSLLEFGDFNVFIGGNAVGKTTLIVELFSRTTNLQRPRWHWITDDIITYSSDNPVGDLRLLMGSMTRQYEGANVFYYSQAAKNIDGNIALDGNLRFGQAECEDLRRRADEGGPIDMTADLRYRRPFIAFASCEARLNLPNQVNVTSLNQPPQDAVNVLFRNQDLLGEIDEKVYAQFRLHLGLLDHTRTQLELGLNEEVAPQFDTAVRDRQQEFARIEDWKGQHFVHVQDIGHGIRSMVKLLMTLLDPVNQIILIDEPEMHIYPAQKRWLGRQLISLARERGKQVFVVTHDPIVLQGILEGPATTRIFRVDVEDDGLRVIKRCDMETVTDVGARRNQDSFLQGLFYQRCIGVEGSTDRAFYQVMTEELFQNRIEDKDLGFVACGGKGGSKNMVYIASKVGLRSAFIYDFDALLFDVELMAEIMRMRGGSGDKLAALRELLEREFGLDAKRIKTGTGNAEKVGFASPFVISYQQVFEAAISELAKAGVFIVQGGSLESWAPDAEPKFRFAEVAPDRIKGDLTLKEKVKAFLDTVLRFVGC